MNESAHTKQLKGSAWTEKLSAFNFIIVYSLKGRAFYYIISHVSMSSGELIYIMVFFLYK